MFFHTIDKIVYNLYNHWHHSWDPFFHFFYKGNSNKMDNIYPHSHRFHIYTHLLNVNYGVINHILLSLVPFVVIYQTILNKLKILRFETVRLEGEVISADSETIVVLDRR